MPEGYLIPIDLGIPGANELNELWIDLLVFRTWKQRQNTQKSYYLLDPLEVVDDDVEAKSSRKEQKSPMTQDCQTSESV